MRLVEGDPFEQWASDGDFLLGAEVTPVRILAPVEHPSKIVAIGLNYRAHAAEANKPLPIEPMMFLKPPSSIVGPGDAIRLPPGVGRVDHEAEVAVVIGRRAYQVPRERVWDHVLGVTGFNDVSARVLQRRDIQFARAKGFDTFTPLGPCILTGDRGPFAVEAWLNGECRQTSSTADLIFGLEELVTFVSHVMTLLPGDVIASGTPSGVGPINPGDTVTIRVGGVGDLTNPVVEQALPAE